MTKHLRRISVFLLLFSLSGGVSFASDNSARIKELESELKQISETIQQKQGEIGQLTQKGLMDEGALEELKKIEGKSKNGSTTK